MSFQIKLGKQIHRGNPQGACWENMSVDNVTEDIKYVNLWIGGNMGSLSERKKFGKDDAGCRGGAKHQGGCHQRRVI